MSLSLLFSSMRGRQQLSCPVPRPPSGPNACPQDNISSSSSSIYLPQIKTFIIITEYI